MGTERELPRPKGMMQKVQRWSQPFCTCTKARERPSRPSMRCAAVSLTAMMSLTAIFSSAATPKDARAKTLRCCHQACALIFSSLPSTNSQYGMWAKALGSACAGKPVATTARAGYMTRRPGGARRSAGGGGAGLGEAGATLPGAQDEVVARRHLRERNVRAFRKDRMVFQQRAELAEVIGAGVVDPEDGGGIAHADDGRRMQDRLGPPAGLQRRGARVGR